MSQADRQQVIDALKKSQENFAVTIGVTFALLLSIYFFTYATFTDKGMSGMLWFQGITALLMLMALIKLKHVSFAMARIWLKRKADYRNTLATLSVHDLNT